MKTNSSLKTVLALLAVAAIVSLLSTNAEAGNRRPTGAQAPITTSSTSPAISLP